MINIKNILSELLILGAVISSILVITAKNPIISMIFLISVVLNAALYLIVNGIHFMGISYILIYLGAIIVLFLFVIMMINVKLTDILDIGYQYTKNIPLALTIITLFMYFFFYLVPFYINNPTFNIEGNSLIFSFKNTVLEINSYLFQDQGMSFISEINNSSLLSNLNWPETVIFYSNHINSVANSLYTYGAIWFLFTSLILLLAMIAPIYISKK